MDDFGTGYSSLGYLDRLPVDVLKIDKIFINRLAGSGEEGTALIAAILRIAQTLGLETVAEGVERPEQAAGSAPSAATRPKATCTPSHCRSRRSTTS